MGRMRTRELQVSGLVVLTALVALLVPGVARACGGFFCNRQAPVEQAGEQILFAVEDGDVVAHIQIQYEGPPTEFAWVVPVPAMPELGTGTEELFTQLGARTLPDFATRRDQWDSCTDGVNPLSGSAGGARGVADEGESGGHGVDVTFRGAVGPYDAAVVSSEDPAELLTWLEQNGYDLPEGADDLIGSYVAKGDHFVALKLLADRDDGDLVPITLRFAWDGPCIPIRLTSIAAVPDMSIRTWIIGNARAVPTNFRHVLIDLARLDWECGPSNYTSVVTDAANEADGHAFVTEYAGPSDLMRGALYDDARIRLDELSGASSAYDFIWRVLGQGLSPTNALRAVLANHIVAPEGGDARAFIDQLLDDCYLDQCGAECGGTGGYYCNTIENNQSYLTGVEFDAQRGGRAGLGEDLSIFRSQLPEKIFNRDHLAPVTLRHRR